MKTALLFILMMLVLIAPHEFGHFIVAKLCNVKVNEFSVGMGPLLFKKKKGVTQYSLRLIPIGGFCAMEGEENASDNPRAFNNKPPLQKIAILLAGVTMNVIIAIIACTIAFQVSGVPVATLDSVVKDSPAAVAGMQRGDKIIEVDGIKTPDWTSVTEAISSYEGKGDMEILVRRDGEERSFFIVPQYDENRQGYTIGIVAGITRNPFICAKYGIVTTWELNKQMLGAFKLLFTGGLHKDDVSGPVGLVKIVDQTASVGATAYLILLALVSLNLALINLLPIPGLDGGKIFFVLLKVITCGRINDESEYKATLVGMFILICIFVFVTINDVTNILK